MSDSSWIDHIPSQEREKIRKRMRSPEAYEKLREKVKGPEDLEREMEKNAEFAETKLAIETDPSAQEKSKETVKAFVAEKGSDAAFESSSDGLQEALRSGNFEVSVDAQSKEPRLAVKMKNAPQKTPTDAPSGNVSEVFPLKASLQQKIVASFTLKGKGE